MRVEPEDLGYEIFFAESGRYEYVKFLPVKDNLFFGLEIIQDGRQNFVFSAESGRSEYIKFLPAKNNLFFGLEIIQDGRQNFGWLVVTLSDDPGEFDEAEKVLLLEAPKELVSVCEIDDFLMKEAQSGKHYLQ